MSLRGGEMFSKSLAAVSMYDGKEASNLSPYPLLILQELEILFITP